MLHTWSRVLYFHIPIFLIRIHELTTSYTYRHLLLPSPALSSPASNVSGASSNTLIPVLPERLGSSDLNTTNYDVATSCHVNHDLGKPQLVRMRAQGQVDDLWDDVSRFFFCYFSISIFSSATIFLRYRGQRRATKRGAGGCPRVARFCLPVAFRCP
jgi:hypothetical protein